MTLASPRDFERGSAWASAARWGVAMLAIAAAHAGAAWFLVHMPPVATPPAGAPEAPILIELAQPALEPPAAPAMEAPEPEVEPQETPPEPTPPEPEPDPMPPPPEPLPPPVEEPPPPVEEPAPVETPEPEPAPVPEPPPEPQPELPVVPEQAEAVINAPIPRARPRPPEPKREVAEKRPERKREVERPRERERPRTERRPPAAAPAASASRAAPDTTQGQRARPSVTPARWQSQVQARLNRFKRTPRGGGAGTVRVSFTITGSGAASGIRLAGSSGNPILDEAALSLVRRASPFPAPPDGGSVSMTVPIAYTR